MKKLHINSVCSHEHRIKKEIRANQLPIYATSSFTFDNIEQGMDVFLGKRAEHLYARYGNPTVDTVAEKIAMLETHGLNIAAKAYLTSSGMSAISTVLLSLLGAGDKVLVPGNIYGGTTVLLRDVLSHLNIERVTASFKDLAALEAILKKDKKIKVLYFETPTNPTMECVDMAAIAKIGHENGCKVVIDNTFCTPYLQQPFAYGIDFIIHSTTKYLNGHGNSLAGVIVGKEIDFMSTEVFKRLIMLGTNSNPFDAWLLNNGLKTLALRMERHSENALAVAQFLQTHAKIRQVNYPGLTTHPDYTLATQQMKLYGGMLSFELIGGLEAGKQMMNAVQLCTLAPTLGDVETLMMHPASMSHAKIPKAIRDAHGISDGLIRLSVGIEQKEDIIGDLEQAMEQLRV